MSSPVSDGSVPGFAPNDPAEGTRNPRVLLFSQRGLDGLLSRSITCEFEDVILGIDDVTLIAPGPTPSYPWRNRLANQLAKRLPIIVNPGLDRIPVEPDYDLFLAVAEFPWDLSALAAMPDWRRRCRRAICWIEELWPGQLSTFRGYAKLLSRFDHVILNCKHTAEPLQSMIGTPCHYLPPGVDAIRFCPYPDPPQRNIHVYSIGRRGPVTHEALLRHCERERLWFVHDTVNTHQPKQTDNLQSHRNLFANTAKRSRYFVANVAKIDLRFGIAAKQEVGSRFFEGAAAGTVMFGEPPDTEVFRELFDWPDAVIRVPYDSPDAPAILTELDRDPERLARIRRDNIVNSLLRHDCLYRWQKIIDLAGLDPLPAFHQRENRLRELAELAKQDL